MKQAVVGLELFRREMETRVGFHMVVINWHQREDGRRSFLKMRGRLGQINLQAWTRLCAMDRLLKRGGESRKRGHSNSSLRNMTSLNARITTFLWSGPSGKPG